MPIKYNLTKYDTLASKIKKLSAKKDNPDLTAQERNTMLKAVIVAAFASGHSWQTYKHVTTHNGFSARSPEIKQEFSEALSQKWKLISPFDIGEVSTMNLSDTAFSEWLYSAVDREHQDALKAAWGDLKEELSESCDEVERASTQ